MLLLLLLSQARVNRQRFSSEGIYQSDGGGVTFPASHGNHSPVSESGEGGRGSSLKRGLTPSLKFSHFASVESAEVLQAATADLVKIFQLQVLTFILCKYSFFFSSLR